MMQNKFSATKIGLYFTLFCLLPYLSMLFPFSFFYYFIGFPIISLVPILMPLEMLVSLFVDSQDVSTHGYCVIFSMVLLISYSIFILFRYFKNQILEKGYLNNSSFIKFLVLQFFLVNPLFFYLYLALDWNKSNDGQIILNSIYTFPISGISFLIYGIVVDHMRLNYWIKK